MSKWEYKVERMTFSAYDKKALEIFLFELGREGWELVTIIPLGVIPAWHDYPALIFKRPLP